jgi:hypothetical protein
MTPSIDAPVPNPTPKFHQCGNRTFDLADPYQRYHCFSCTSNHTETIDRHNDLQVTLEHFITSHIPEATIRNKRLEAGSNRDNHSISMPIYHNILRSPLMPGSRSSVYPPTCVAHRRPYSQRVKTRKLRSIIFKWKTVSYSLLCTFYYPHYRKHRSQNSGMEAYVSSRRYFQDFPIQAHLHLPCYILT